MPVAPSHILVAIIHLSKLIARYKPGRQILYSSNSLWSEISSLRMPNTTRSDGSVVVFLWLCDNLSQNHWQLPRVPSDKLRKLCSQIVWLVSHECPEAKGTSTVVTLPNLHNILSVNTCGKSISISSFETVFDIFAFRILPIFGSKCYFEWSNKRSAPGINLPKISPSGECVPPLLRGLLRISSQHLISIGRFRAPNRVHRSEELFREISFEWLWTTKLTTFSPAHGLHLCFLWLSSICRVFYPLEPIKFWFGISLCIPQIAILPLRLFFKKMKSPQPPISPSETAKCPKTLLSHCKTVLMTE